MRKFNLNNIIVELEDNFNNVLKDGLKENMLGKFLEFTDDVGVSINGNHNYHGYYLGRYPSTLRLMIHCNSCDSFVMKIACNVGGELNEILNIESTKERDCKHFPYEEDD